MEESTVNKRYVLLQRCQAGLVSLAMAGLTPLVLAQAADGSAAQAWRQANETVGQFRRGHIDLLKWEQAHPVAPPAAQDSSALLALLALPSAEAAVQQSWQARPELAAVLQRLRAADRERLATGRWDELDPSVLRRVDGWGELLEATLQVRKAWWQAAASHAAWQTAVAARDAAQVGYELGERMVAVGNWSKLAQAPQRLAWANARQDSARAHASAMQDQTRLLKLLAQGGRFAGVQWPATLPEPAAVVSQPAFESRLQRLRRLYGAVGARIRGDALLAYDNAVDAFTAAQASADTVATREMVVEETQLHYSGMLKSTWDLLAEVQALAQAQVADVYAKRDAALAQIDLDWVLLGGEPEAPSAVSLAPAAGAGGGGD